MVVYPPIMFYSSPALCVLILQFLLQNVQISGQYIGARQRNYNHPIRAQKIQRGDQPPPPDIDLDLEGGTLQEIHPLTDIYKFRPRQGFKYHQGYEPKKLHPCEQSSCYPATGNLLIGRESQLYASSTCGLHGQQRYCIVSHLDEERKKCFWCDSRPTAKPNPLYNHNISNIVYRMYPGTRQRSWWQSENGKEKVFIQLDLEAEFHFTHLIITFKTFRPAAMLIERSYDFNQTWQVYRYFAHNCTESFPGIREGIAKNLTDIVCESRYSGVAPSTDGEIIYRVLPPNLPIDNPYSEQVQGLLKITNLRINFTKLHTLGDDLLDRREEIQEKYYYAITDMVVRGSCSCYGHANRCLPLPGIDPKPDMVHGRCECTHNTKGRNCEKCEDFFNDLPWRPAIGKQTNACKRCNCNNHATSCHFDAALYEITGHVSGGVCDGCQHNTMGSNCEQCKPYFYRDPQRDIQDPEVCRPCDCDPHGSLDGGICDSVTDPIDSLVAGSCHCKTNVEGRRCDYCKNGYWNFTDVNPDGCQQCTCDTFGTIGNQGCNVYTGECTCKRYVTGRDCNQCLPEYWGLSDKKDGCQPCDCDPGGSFDNICDVITGQCKCREHMTGRTCDTPVQQYFTASLDFLLYEAEASKSSGQVVIREPYRDGREDTWTGTGFVKVFEGGYLEIIVDEIKTSLDYDIVIRYEPILAENWEDVIVTIVRPPHDQVDPNGPCAHINVEDDLKRVSLPANSRSVTVYPPACLEAGKTYRVRLDFRRSNFAKDTPSASVLIDSIVLIPRIDNIPFFHGTTGGDDKRNEFERYHCSNPSYYGKTGKIPEVCKKLHASIGAYVFNGAFYCQCDPTGSVSKLCDPNGGFCTCKPNVVGRRCDRCAPGTYDFGPEGCRACDCNSIGALDNFCNATTGQCRCRANTYGRECDQCRTGFWRFPNCERCDCNGHADICEAKTGVCINCRDNTQGDHCEFCTDSFYGDPRINVDIPCRPCPCPGPVGSNHSYAERCSLDATTKDVICDCKEGYSGARCDVCSDNYYGNPEIPGGFCTPCNCNDKIDLLAPGNCDPHSGKCLRCLYETTGDHCEVCRPGYFRFDDEPCDECLCHFLGTNSSAGPCDPSGGQCPCFPNVMGLKCYACTPNHWKIASGEGCESCACDPLGSISPQCNEFDGQCQCKPEFGGRQCNECMPRHYGDPKVQCLRCECDRLGARTEQCNMQTGACVCVTGVGGYKCDRCARGFIGNVPDCFPCGECFDNWDRILQETKNQTLDLIDRAGEIKKGGATGAYTKEFDKMQSKLDDIEQLLNNTDDIDIDTIEHDLQMLRDAINKTENQLNQLDDELDDNKQTILLKEVKLQTLNDSFNELKKKIKDLENNGTKLQEANVQGALTLINNAKEKADRAAHKAEHSQEDVKYADTQCKATEAHINATEKIYRKQSEDNKNELLNITNKINELNSQIPELNHLVCDGNGDPCDSICGGAGCNSCGNSISCANGAKQQAETAILNANDTEIALRSKEAMANDFIRNVSQINTNETRNIAQETYDKIFDELTKANNSLKEAADLRNEMKDFLGQNNTKPEDIKKLAHEVLEKNVQKTPEEVKELAENIKDAVDRLSNTDYIIEATKNDLAKVNQLKDYAKYAKSNATKLLKDAEQVNDSLNQTQHAQVEAEEAIAKAWDDYRTVEKILYQIGNDTEAAQSTTGDINDHILILKDKLTDLQRNITDNVIFASRVVNESYNIANNAQKTKDESRTLEDKYNTARNELDQKLNSVKSTKERAGELNTKALNLFAKVTKTQEDIKKLEESSHGEELASLEKQLEDLIKTMNKHTMILEDKVKYYKTCN